MLRCTVSELEFITPSKLPGVLVFEPKVFGDEQGFFMETWNEACYRNASLPACFVQDNLSFSRRGVLRILLFQNPNQQGKLVYVLQGEVYDMVVDHPGWLANLRRVDGRHPLFGEQALVLYPRRVCSRLPRHQQEGALRLQVHRQL